MRRALAVLSLALMLTTGTATAGTVEDRERYQYAQPENDFSAVAMGVPLVWNSKFGKNVLGLTGAGQVIGIADNGLDIGILNKLHPDLVNKIIGIKDYSGDGWDDPSGHGTHITASIVGSGEKSGGQYKGIAPGAGIYFQATYETKTGSLIMPDIYSMLADAYNNGTARIHSNSWGFSEQAGEYDGNAYSLDKFVWDHQDMLVLKSAGNEGKSSPVSSPGTAKNVLTVGATENPRAKDEDSDSVGQVAEFSSSGTDDGRIKPDLVAPGTWVRSAFRPDEKINDAAYYNYLSGTSVATAMAAGAAALTRQYFTDIEKISPTSALVKAALIYGARELPGEPRHTQGFGLIDVETSIMALEDQSTKYRDGAEVKNGEMYRFKATSDGLTPLKVVLVWNDYPQLPGPYNALVNDLDLKITTPDGRVLWGNRINGGDRKNNVEVVTFNNPIAGEYLIDVKGTKINNGPQPFSIIYGSLPLLGTVKYSYPEGQRVEARDGRLIEIDPATQVKLVENDKLNPEATLENLRGGTNIYYYPSSSQRKESKLEAVYNMIYATMTNMVGQEKLIEYHDVAGHWAEKEIGRMSELKIIQGWPDGTFHPDDQVTRAQFAAMLVRALKLVESPYSAAGFHDITADSWCRGSVGAAVAAGIVQGYTTNTFGPNDPITREQMAAMVARAVSGTDLAELKESEALDAFTDADVIEQWARPAVSLMVENKIFNGRTETSFEPKGTTTRAEATAVLLRIFNVL